MSVACSLEEMTIADLAVLQGVFDRICNERDLDPQSRAAELLAGEILELLDSGLETEDEFLQIISGRKNLV